MEAGIIGCESVYSIRTVFERFLSHDDITLIIDTDGQTTRVDMTVMSIHRQAEQLQFKVIARKGDLRFEIAYTDDGRVYCQTFNDPTE